MGRYGTPDCDAASRVKSSTTLLELRDILSRMLKASPSTAQLPVIFETHHKGFHPIQVVERVVYASTLGIPLVTIRSSDRPRNSCIRCGVRTRSTPVCAYCSAAACKPPIYPIIYPNYDGAWGLYCAATMQADPFLTKCREFLGSSWEHLLDGASVAEVYHRLWYLGRTYLMETSPSNKRATKVTCIEFSSPAPKNFTEFCRYIYEEDSNEQEKSDDLSRDDNPS